ncbi:hypothetical protein AGMMS49940_21310 [Spirochaetia bacterium]|nr:hypothetical protein AGMMS49940_21310 [Spirochaetia bacterium]
MNNEISIDSKLFRNSFNVTKWKNEEKLSLLQANIIACERTIVKYLDGIPTDFPFLTDHSLSHSKALWKYADLIIGDSDDYINPLEAFVLHIAFLIHDSGMCLSILNKADELKSNPLYLDYVIQHGDNDENQKSALFYVVRQLHGEFAQQIATQKLRNDEYLLNDISLREELGLFIGKIARSHSENINYIEREFGQPYTCATFPTDWSIDHTKLAFILRVSDAAHIDNLRTPKTVKLITEMEGLSGEHWTFQKKIGFPTLSNDKLLIYTANVPFTAKEQKAWWVCYEALSVLDSELKMANEYFAVRGKKEFAAKGVKSINDTLQLGKEIVRTEGWDSIDTTIRVSNPIHIAMELGGVKLYGNINIAVRELLQNSIDAINLHRTVTGQNENLDVGEIKISLENNDGNFFLVISDNGIGMSQTLLTNELLDFGGSYWKSKQFNYDFQGAGYKGFESIGKFGIGFFSVFMLGVQIKVTSWKYGEDISKMKTLDFYDSLNSNPILRDPTDEEKRRVIDRGTSIKIKLHDDPYSQKGFIGNMCFTDNTLYTLVRYFVPSASVKITISELDKSQKQLYPHHMENLSFNDFINYINFPKINEGGPHYPVEILHQFNLNFIELNDNGKILGKLAVLPNLNNYAPSPLTIIISNGIRIKEIGGFAGFLFSKDVVSIRRDACTKTVPYDILKEWAIKQKAMIESNQLFMALYQHKYNSILISFKLYNENTPILLSKKNNTYSLVSIKAFRAVLKIYQELSIHTEGHKSESQLPSCNGFIFYPHDFNANEILIDADVDKILNYNDLIELIIKEEWGGNFEKTIQNPINDNFNNPMFIFDLLDKLPYTYIVIYKRKVGYP